MPWWIILLVVAAVLVWYRFAPRLKSYAKERQLEGQYRRLMRLSESEGEAAIRRQIEQLKRRHPGRSRAWYLEKMIYDLQRDR